MSKTKITLSIYEITTKYITIKLSSPIQALDKRHIRFLLNQQDYTDFILEELLLGELYRLTPNTPFTPYSQLTISINNNNYSSNMLSIFYSKKYVDDTSDYYIRIPENLSSGNYKIKLQCLNDVPFTLESTDIVISQRINPDYCYVTQNKITPYSVNEDVILTLTLKDIFNEPIPDGLYEIQLNVKKL